MMMAIKARNLHDKVCTYYAAKVGSKNLENTGNVWNNDTQEDL